MKYSGATGKRVAPASVSATGVGVDGNGYVYATVGPSVYKYSNSLTHLATIGEKGSGEGELMSAKDVAGEVGVSNEPCKRYSDKDPANDNGVISALDSSLHRVEQFVYPFGEGGPDPPTRAAANCG